MPYTVAVSFDKFREVIEPLPYQRETATNRKDHLLSLLSDDFVINDSFASGSLPKYTAVAGYADLDIIVVLHYSKHVKDKKPSEVLLSVRNSLAKYRTEIRRNGQAVTLYYKTWPNVDIVPVSCTTNSDGSVNHYNVPDMNTETWIASQPKRHATEMEQSNQDFGKEFKRIVKMIKWWNHQHSSLLESYHIEVMALKSLTGTFSDYPWDIYQFFKSMVNLVNGPLYHNVDFVDTYLNWKKREEALKRLERARDLASQAWYKTYNSNDDHKGAIEIYRQIFGDKFPNYG